jgi:hypothetical protein
MGYTHYFTPKAHTDEQWDSFVDAVKELHENLPENVKSILGDGMGQNKPVLNEPTEWSDGNPVVCFNGLEDKEEDYETFCIIKNKIEWDFCKTARKTYDLFVCVVLMAAKEHLDFEISTDGDREDWEEAIELYIDTFYAEKPNSLEEVLPEF